MEDTAVLMAKTLDSSSVIPDWSTCLVFLPDIERQFIMLVDLYIWYQVS